MLMIGVPSLLLMVAWFTSLGWYGMPLFCLLLSSLMFLPPKQPEAHSPYPGAYPTLTYLAAPSPSEPVFTIQRGQIITIPAPHSLQIIVPDGIHLEILEATPERVRVMAV